MKFQDYQLMNNETKYNVVPNLRFPEFQNAEEWAELTLVELATFRRGSFPQPYGLPEWYDDINGMPFIQVFDVADNFLLKPKTKSKISELAAKQSIFIPKGTVIITIQGSIGRVAITQYDAYIDRTLLLFETFLKPTNKAFFSYVLFMLFEIEKLKAPGGIIKTITKEVLSDFIISLPKPLEQQKIASCLSSLDDLITAHTQKLLALKTHKKGLMQTLFPAEGETVPKLRFKEFKNSGDWEEKTLGEICKITSGGTPSRSMDGYWNGAIPWISTTLIDFNTINTANEYITEVGLQNSSAKIFPKNTILMAMYGQGITRGKVAILGIEAATNQACAALLLKEGFNTNFVFQNLAGRYDEIRELSNQGGQENLSAGLIEIIPISIPPNTSEQQKIASCLSTLDEFITAQTQKIETLKGHKKGLMQGLFPSINDNN